MNKKEIFLYARSLRFYKNCKESYIIYKLMYKLYKNQLLSLGVGGNLGVIRIKKETVKSDCAVNLNKKY